MGISREPARWPGRAGARARSAHRCAPPCVSCPPRTPCPSCPARPPRGRPPWPGRLGAGRVTAPAVRTDSTGKSRVRCRGMAGRAASPPEADMAPPSARGRYTTGQLWESPGLCGRSPRSQETRRWSPGRSGDRSDQGPDATEFAGSLGDRTPREIECFIISGQSRPEKRVPAEQFCAHAGSPTAICSEAELPRRSVDISEPTRSRTRFGSPRAFCPSDCRTGRRQGCSPVSPPDSVTDKATHSCRSDRRREMRAWSSLRCGFSGRRLDGHGDDAGS
ncbi:hypothetical protein SAMN04489717_4224 [Actinopolymorpha singaporensis]|uniref:Uncharacterized protein n=1 Tax=Actinopolymorpha singaporensis TaxID=117157 RepID=A0A1H1VUV3_9ACTN|nr:hypothetical protein SAMN04489717_4224 [Actinopolymorpha singaporensis]